ncbi:MAG: hypothetical protein IKK49_02625 [Clostridia bacterium]|nr:hypothetical protein [Clostridia bacterium]
MTESIWNGFKRLDFLFEGREAVLEKYYRENGGTIVSIGKANCAHHPHGLEDNTPIIEFVEKYST